MMSSEALALNIVTEATLSNRRTCLAAWMGAGAVRDVTKGRGNPSFFFAIKLFRAIFLS